MVSICIVFGLYKKRANRSFRDNESYIIRVDTRRFINTCIYNILMSTSSVYTTKIPVSAWKVLAILGSIATMTMYAETMLIPAIPDLIKDFHVSYSISFWLLTAYLITAAVMTPIVGKLSDTYGKKKVLLTVMIIYALVR